MRESSWNPKRKLGRRRMAWKKSWKRRKRRKNPNPRAEPGNSQLFPPLLGYSRFFFPAFPKFPLPFIPLFPQSHAPERREFRPPQPEEKNVFPRIPEGKIPSETGQTFPNRFFGNRRPLPRWNFSVWNFFFPSGLEAEVEEKVGAVRRRSRRLLPVRREGALGVGMPRSGREFGNFFGDKTTGKG